MNWTIQWKRRDCEDEQKARFDYVLSAQGVKDPNKLQVKRGGKDRRSKPKKVRVDTIMQSKLQVKENYQSWRVTFLNDKLSFHNENLKF